MFRKTLKYAGKNSRNIYDIKNKLAFSNTLYLKIITQVFPTNERRKWRKYQRGVFIKHKWGATATISQNMWL